MEKTATATLSSIFDFYCQTWIVYFGNVCWRLFCWTWKGSGWVWTGCPSWSTAGPQLFHSWSTQGRVAAGFASNQSSRHRLTNQLPGDSDQLMGRSGAAAGWNSCGTAGTSCVTMTFLMLFFLFYLFFLMLVGIFFLPVGCACLSTCLTLEVWLFFVRSQSYSLCMFWTGSRTFLPCRVEPSYRFHVRNLEASCCFTTGENVVPPRLVWT